MKTKVILVAAIVLFFAAGLSLGLLIAKPHHQPPRHGNGRIEGELHLTPLQSEQMRKIWFDVMAGTRHWGDEERTAINKEREQKTHALFSQEQLAQYEELQQDYHHKMDNLLQARRQATDKAVDEQVRKILTPEQIVKYDALMKDLRQRGPSSGPGGRPDGMGEGRPEGMGEGIGEQDGPRGPRYRYPTSTSRPTTRE